MYPSLWEKIWKNICGHQPALLGASRHQTPVAQMDTINTGWQEPVGTAYWQPPAVSGHQGPLAPAGTGHFWDSWGTWGSDRQQAPAVGTGHQQVPPGTSGRKAAADSTGTTRHHQAVDREHQQALAGTSKHRAMGITREVMEIIFEP